MGQSRVIRQGRGRARRTWARGRTGHALERASQRPRPTEKGLEPPKRHPPKAHPSAEKINEDLGGRARGGSSEGGEEDGHTAM